MGCGFGCKSYWDVLIILKFAGRNKGPGPFGEGLQNALSLPASRLEDVLVKWHKTEEKVTVLHRQC